MAQRDPFENYRRRREIELMESRFKEKAAAQRKRLEEILSQDAEPGELEKRVTEEMEEFLAESTRTAERMLEDFREEDEGLVRSGSPVAVARKEEPPSGAAPKPPREPAPKPGSKSPPAPPPKPVPSSKPAPSSKPSSPSAPPQPSIRERRPLGAGQSLSRDPVDLNEALARIKQHQQNRGKAPGPAAGREPAEGRTLRPATGRPKAPERVPPPDSAPRVERRKAERRPAQPDSAFFEPSRDAPGRPQAPAVPPEEADPGGPAVGDLSKSEILSSFDETFHQVSELIQKRMEAEGLDEAEVAEEREGGQRAADAARDARMREETFDFGMPAPDGAEPGAPEPDEDPASPQDAASLYRERIRQSGVMLGNEGDAPPPAGGPEGLGEPEVGVDAAAAGAPPGVTNVFSAEPDEDRDIDDDVDADAPAGWNLPVRPPPPGAWVVRKQKEEGEAALAGVAGDTYLLKKLSREVSALNALYLALLKKGVVTREEVEGSGEAAPPRPERKPAPASDDEDDDVVTVDDYDEDRFRPIDTSEKDFSLSALVQDIHRLKTLRGVLLKKGVVTDKEIEKAKK